MWRQSLLGHGAAMAKEVKEVLFVHMPFEESSIRRVLVDVTFIDIHALLLQKTSGVTARCSSRFPEESGLWHTGRFYRQAGASISAARGGCRTIEGRRAHDQRDLPFDSGRVDP